VYFIFPALLLLAVRGAVLLAGWRPMLPARTGCWWPKIYTSTPNINLIMAAVHMARMHPYQNIYFNVLAGKDTAYRYEMNYWGLSQWGGNG
jgi:hypothetical protein